MFQLYGYTGSHQGRSMPLDQAATVLGRDESCDIVLGRNHPIEARVVSRQHATIHRDESGCSIEDGNGQGKPSLQRTFVNDVPVPFPGRMVLKHRDVIRIGNSMFLFYDDTVEMTVEDPALLQIGLGRLLGRWKVFATWDPCETEIDPVVQESYFEFPAAGGGEFLFAGLRGRIMRLRPVPLSGREAFEVEWTWQGMRLQEPDSPLAVWNSQTWGSLREFGDSQSFEGLGSGTLTRHDVLEGRMLEIGFLARRAEKNQ